MLKPSPNHGTVRLHNDDDEVDPVGNAWHAELTKHSQYTGVHDIRTWSVYCPAFIKQKVKIFAKPVSASISVPAGLSTRSSRQCSVPINFLLYVTLFFLNQKDLFSWIIDTHCKDSGRVNCVYTKTVRALVCKCLRVSERMCIFVLALCSIACSALGRTIHPMLITATASDAGDRSCACPAIVCVWHYNKAFLKMCQQQ